MSETTSSTLSEEAVCDLADRSCEACRAGAPTVTDAEIEAFGTVVPDWEIVVEDGSRKLRRDYGFHNFVDALAFTNEVGALAESEGHHPDIVTRWGGVEVIWWSHKIRDLHVNDFVMAAKCDAAYTAA